MILCITQISYPKEGDDFEIIVDRVNKMGVLGYIKINDNDFNGSPLIIIIPTEYFNSTTRDINSITKNQKLMIKVLGCRIKFNSKKIQIVAKRLGKLNYYILFILLIMDIDSKRKFIYENIDFINDQNEIYFIIMIN